MHIAAISQEVPVAAMLLKRYPVGAIRQEHPPHWLPVQYMCGGAVKNTT
jgi:hypothetical protein